jgi:hypothetical protein
LKVDINEQEKIILQITSQNIEQRKVTLRAFSRFVLIEQLDIFQKQKNIFHKLRNSLNIKLDLLSYCALIIAINIYINESKNFKSLDFEKLSLEEIKKLSIKKAEVFLLKKRRKQKKQEQVLNYWSIIKSLKSENYSFRDIQKYLKKYHRFEVSYSTLFSCWKKFEEKG